MCKLRNVGRINYNDVVLLKQRFCLFEYLYCEFGPAAVEFVDKDDGSVGYLGKIGLNEFVNFASKFFLIFVLFEKIGSAEIFNDTIDVTAISDKGSGGFYGANDPLAEILSPLDALLVCGISDGGQYGQDRILEMVVFPCVEINGQTWRRGEFCCGFS